MSAPSIDDLETASFNAWPALRSIFVGGWLVRMADGYTKRANSANFLRPHAMPADEAIARCSHLYSSQGLRPTFRLVERRETAAVERQLADTGWAQLEPSLVMHTPLDRAFPATGTVPSVTMLPLDAWLDEHARMAGQDAATAARHRRLLSQLALAAFPAIVREGGEIVACGLAVADGALLGFFDIVTAAAHRGRGHARRLMNGQASAARAAGATQAWLQVVAANAPAVGLYRKLGFETSHRYSYRIAP